MLAVIALLIPSLSGAQRAAPAASELRDTVDLYSNDRGALLRRYDVDYSPARQERIRRFTAEWRDRLRKIGFDGLSQEGKVDYVLLSAEIEYQLAEQAREAKLAAEMAPWIPFVATITTALESRRRMEVPDPSALAASFAKLADSIDAARQRAGDAFKAGGLNRIVGRRTALHLRDLQQSLARWHGFYAAYDPVFTWWMANPYDKVDKALGAYGTFLREQVAGIKQGQPEPIIGDPIGADGLRADLAHDMISYSVEELIAIAEREYAWCEVEFKKAAREMGFGDDWKAALEKVKQTYVPPGDQPRLVRDLALEAIQWVESRNLVTVPPLSKEVWRMEMIPPERQLVSPFFLGGEVFQVSYPTDEMAHGDKLMSLRGNNPHFSRAVAHHELIPGHHLQGFMTQRYNRHRQLFGTPFWGEGWALYWEMLMWDMGFPRTPEDRMGMLFWRAHRAARIIFSLSFHLGTMTPQQAVDFLVDKVGHERANAEGEVRRSFAGDYSPLYQAGYMLGGLQFRALHEELVKSGRMTDREFHDAILQGGRMPVEMVRARLTGQRLTRDYRPSWRFAGPVRAASQ
jgi:uncharacterized protein (DUF885 family)